MADYSAGTLTVGVRSDTRPLEQGLSKGRKGVKDFTRDVDKSLGDEFGKTFAKIGGMFAGVFAADKVISFVGSTLESIDELGKQADKLRVSVESLQAYQYAANLADVSNETLTSGLQKMTLNLSAATEESGPALDWLAKLGLSAKELQAADVGTAFERIGGALEKIPEADRLKAVSDIFGKGNTDLVNLFAEGLGGAVDEFNRLGLAMSGDEVARVKEFNDEWEKLSKSIGAIGRGIVIDITPIAMDAVEQIRKFVEFTKSAGDKSGTLLAEASRNKFAALPALPLTFAAQAGLDFTGNSDLANSFRAFNYSAVQSAARGVSDFVTRSQGDTQISVLGQIRDAVKSQKPVGPTIELKPAGAL